MGSTVREKLYDICAAERRSRTGICTIEGSGKECEALSAVFQHGGASSEKMVRSKGKLENWQRATEMEKEKPEVVLKLCFQRGLVVSLKQILSESSSMRKRAAQDVLFGVVDTTCCCPIPHM